jgi:hypothetical protein
MYNMAFPPPTTPLYNHPLPDIETWLRSQGCEQDQNERHCWSLVRSDWRAEIALEVEEIVVRYLKAGADGNDIQRSFPYSLSRSDIEAAIFSGP